MFFKIYNLRKVEKGGRLMLIEKEGLLKKLNLVEVKPENYNLTVLKGKPDPAPQGVRHSAYLIHGDYPHFNHISGAIYRATMKSKKILDAKGRHCNFDMLYVMTRSVADKLAADLASRCVNAHITDKGQVQLYLTSLFPPYAFGAPNKLFSNALLDEMRYLLEVGSEMGASYAGFGALTCTRKRMKTIHSEGSVMPVNDGNILTAIGIVSSLEKALKHKGLKWHNAKIAIVGATGSVGMALCQMLGRERHCIGGDTSLFKQMIICAKTSKRKLSAIANFLREEGSESVVECLGLEETAIGIKSANVVVILTNDPMLKFGAEAFADDVQIICDATRPRSTDSGLPNQLPNVLVYDGPTTLFKGQVLYPEIFGLEENEILCCMAQNALLAEANFDQSFGVYEDNFSSEQDVREFLKNRLSKDILQISKLFYESGWKFSDYFRWHEWILHPFKERKCSRTVAISGFKPTNC